jgi:low temperature requirement protein LtrA
LLTLIALQWFSLRKYDTPDMAALTTRFVVAMGLTITIVVVSAFVADQDARLVLWAAAIGLTVLGTVLQIFRNDPQLEEAFRITESIAERFGLFTIIVLGEVVVGVAGGLAEADRDGRTIATGIASLVIGFGFWWNYFDFVGNANPDPQHSTAECGTSPTSRCGWLSPMPAPAWSASSNMPATAAPLPTQPGSSPALPR